MPITLAPGAAIDIGTSGLVSARRVLESQEVQYSEVRDAYFKIKPPTPISAKMVEKGLANQKYFKDTDGSFVVVGQDAIERAVERHQSVSRPMVKGVLSPADPHARRILKFIIQDLLGMPREPGEKVVFSVPAHPIDYRDEDFNVLYHEDCIRQDLSSLGYTAVSLNEAEAICYSELESTDFTGISASAGAGMINVCIMSSGEAIMKFSLAGSGDKIDRMAAAATGEPDSVVQFEKEHGDFTVGIEHPSNRILTAVALSYTRLIDYFVKNLELKLNRASSLPKFSGPIPLVVAGGTSLAKGFIPYLETALRGCQLPLKISEVRHADSPLQVVARGCLLGVTLV